MKKILLFAALGLLMWSCSKEALTEPQIIDNVTIEEVQDVQETKAAPIMRLKQLRPSYPEVFVPGQRYVFYVENVEYYTSQPDFLAMRYLVNGVQQPYYDGMDWGYQGYVMFPDYGENILVCEIIFKGDFSWAPTAKITRTINVRPHWM